MFVQLTSVLLRRSMNFSVSLPSDFSLRDPLPFVGRLTAFVDLAGLEAFAAFPGLAGLEGLEGFAFVGLAGLEGLEVPSLIVVR